MAEIASLSKQLPQDGFLPLFIAVTDENGMSTCRWLVNIAQGQLEPGAKGAILITDAGAIFPLAEQADSSDDSLSMMSASFRIALEALVNWLDEEIDDPERTSLFQPHPLSRVLVPMIVHEFGLETKQAEWPPVEDETPED
jgi:hypothetical protein